MSVGFGPAYAAWDLRFNSGGPAGSSTFRTRALRSQKAPTLSP
jgi:hypothetical protein